MTLFFTWPGRVISAFGLVLACALPVALSLPLYAAELEGTPVPVNQSHAVPVQPAVEIQPPAALDHPDANTPELAPQPPVSDENERWMRDNERQMRDNEAHMHQQNEWERDLEKNLNQAFGGDEDGNGFNPAILIPLFAILFIFGGPIILLVLILVFFFGAKRRRQQDINMNIDKLLAAGRDIPVELLRGDEPRSAVEIGNRDKGIRNLFLGTGWLVFLTVLVGFDIGAAGFIWIALGASQVLIWYLNNPKNSVQAGQQD
jgi:hypothetical protein